MRAGVLVESILFAVAGALLLVGYGTGTTGGDGFDPGARVEGSIRIVTWNVGGSLEAGGEALSDDHLDHVASVLRDLEADLCFLQEVEDRDQARTLRQKLGSEWSSASSRGRSSRRIVALGRLTPLERGDAPSDTRSLLVHVPRHRLGVMVVHADAFSATERNILLGKATDMLAAGAPIPGVLLGDFNLDLDLDKRRDLFTDDEYLDVESYNYVAGRFVDATIGTGSTAEPDRRLDYVFIDGDAFDVSNAGPLRGKRRGNMDHDPVVCDLVRR